MNLIKSEGFDGEYSFGNFDEKSQFVYISGFFLFDKTLKHKINISY